ncbi:GxxExxY protein [Halalkalibaculum sp. DA3122]|uniref:GxxExxY protein n=1 Tax=unclassified Halalkalibaculum TaxID=2964617 RepID=UPI0037552110
MSEISSKPENYLSGIIVDTCFHIHTELGPGLLESVYEEILFYELRKQNMAVQRQQPIPVVWDDINMELGFRADLIVENKVLVELKSVKDLADLHYKQVLTYLKLTNLKLGLLINFNEKLIKNGIKRVVNNL